MRINRCFFVTMVASAVLSSAARSADVEPVDHIVSSQVVSDVVVGGSASSSGTMVGDDFGTSDFGINDSGANDFGTSVLGANGSDCANGTCGVGGRNGLRGNLGRQIGDFGSRGSRGFAGDMNSGCQPRTYGYPDLFYNFYTQGNCNRTNAQMYISPIPVPPNVGHTYITYQPFMPHEMLYPHKDRFHNYYDGGRGMNHTKVHYYAPPIKTAASNIYWNYLRIPR